MTVDEMLREFFTSAGGPPLSDSELESLRLDDPSGFEELCAEVARRYSENSVEVPTDTP